MNRAERRKLMKSSNEYKKIHKTVNDLTSDQVKLIEIVSEQKFNTQFQRLNAVLNDCTGALFIELFPNKSIKEITELQNKLGDMMLEQFKKENKLIEEFGGIEGMKKALEKMEEKVAKEATKLVKKGAKQKESIEILVSKFPKLSKNQLTHAYKQVKEQLKEEKEEKEVEEGVEKIMDIIDHQEVKEEMPKEMEEKVKETAKIAAKNIQEMIENSEEIIEPKEVVPEETKEEVKEVKINKFKPILLQFEGEFATYTKSKDKLVIENDGKVEISSLDVIEEMKKTEIAGLEQQIQIAKAKYAEFKEAFEV